MAIFVKAYICPYREGRPVQDQRFHVQFNPSELSIDEAIGVSETDEDRMDDTDDDRLEGQGMDAQRPMKSTYARRQSDKLTLSTTLFFNTLESVNQTSYEDVRKYVSQLYPYTNRDLNTNKKVEMIYFFWGSIAVAGILSRMHVNYVMFAPDGKPVRAQVDIAIVGDYVGDPSFSAPVVTNGEKKNSDSQSKSVADSPQWREEYKGTGNPRKSGR